MVIPNNSEEQRLEALTKEVTELRALRVFADKKIRALTVFASHQDEAVHLLAGKFQSYHQGQTDMDTLAMGVNDILEKATQAVNTLSAEFPSLEEFVSNTMIPRIFQPQPVSPNGSTTSRNHTRKI